MKNYSFFFCRVPCELLCLGCELALPADLPAFHSLSELFPLNRKEYKEENRWTWFPVRSHGPRLGGQEGGLEGWKVVVQWLWVLGLRRVSLLVLKGRSCPGWRPSRDWARLSPWREALEPHHHMVSSFPCAHAPQSLKCTSPPWHLPPRCPPPPSTSGSQAHPGYSGTCCLVPLQEVGHFDCEQRDLDPPRNRL